MAAQAGRSSPQMLVDLLDSRLYRATTEFGAHTRMQFRSSMFHILMCAPSGSRSCGEFDGEPS
eukprot:3523314-Pyramimonas_sp.AAC.1